VSVSRRAAPPHCGQVALRIFDDLGQLFFLLLKQLSNAGSFFRILSQIQSKLA